MLHCSQAEHCALEEVGSDVRPPDWEDLRHELGGLLGEFSGESEKMPRMYYSRGPCLLHAPAVMTQASPEPVTHEPVQFLSAVHGGGKIFVLGKRDGETNPPLDLVAICVQVSGWVLLRGFCG